MKQKNIIKIYEIAKNLEELAGDATFEKDKTIIKKYSENIIFWLLTKEFGPININTESMLREKISMATMNSQKELESSLKDIVELLQGATE